MMASQTSNALEDRAVVVARDIEVAEAVEVEASTGEASVAEGVEVKVKVAAPTNPPPRCLH
jgi:hypothetical protein